MKILFTLLKSILTTLLLIFGYCFLIFLFEKSWYDLNFSDLSPTFWVVLFLFFIPSFLANYLTDFPDSKYLTKENKQLN
jgi:hypothetical protein